MDLWALLFKVTVAIWRNWASRENFAPASKDAAICGQTVEKMAADTAVDVPMNSIHAAQAGTLCGRANTAGDHFDQKGPQHVDYEFNGGLQDPHAGIVALGAQPAKAGKPRCGAPAATPLIFPGYSKL